MDCVFNQRSVYLTEFVQAKDKETFVVLSKEECIYGRNILYVHVGLQTARTIRCSAVYIFTLM